MHGASVHITRPTAASLNPVVLAPAEEAEGVDSSSLVRVWLTRLTSASISIYHSYHRPDPSLCILSPRRSSRERRFAAPRNARLPRSRLPRVPSSSSPFHLGDSYRQRSCRRCCRRARLVLSGSTRVASSRRLAPTIERPIPAHTSATDVASDASYTSTSQFREHPHPLPRESHLATSRRLDPTCHSACALARGQTQLRPSPPFLPLDFSPSPPPPRHRPREGGGERRVPGREGGEEEAS